MYPFAALADIERHARTLGSDAFPRTWRTHQRCGISVPRPQLEGANGHDGPVGGRFGLQQGSIVQPCRGYLSRLPTCNKGQLSNLVEAICRDFRQHDEGELKKLVEWSKQVKQKASTKEKPARPDVAFYLA